MSLLCLFVSLSMCLSICLFKCLFPFISLYLSFSLSFSLCLASAMCLIKNVSVSVMAIWWSIPSRTAHFMPTECHGHVESCFTLLLGLQNGCDTPHIKIKTKDISTIRFTTFILLLTSLIVKKDECDLL